MPTNRYCRVCRQDLHPTEPGPSCNRCRGFAEYWDSMSPAEQLEEIALWHAYTEESEE